MVAATLRPDGSHSPASQRACRPPTHLAAGGAGCISIGNTEITVALHSSVLACSFLEVGTARGGWQMMVTPRGGAIGTKALVGMKTCAPTIEMGTTRTPALEAMVNGPFLKLMTRPSLERVPSGNAMRLFPAWLGLGKGLG